MVCAGSAARDGSSECWCSSSTHGTTPWPTLPRVAHIMAHIMSHHVTHLSVTSQPRPSIHVTLIPCHYQIDTTPITNEICAGVCKMPTCCTRDDVMMWHGLPDDAMMWHDTPEMMRCGISIMQYERRVSRQMLQQVIQKRRCSQAMLTPRIADLTR